MWVARWVDFFRHYLLEYLASPKIVGKMFKFTCINMMNALLTQGCKWVPARVEVDTAFEKHVFDIAAQAVYSPGS